MNSHKHEHQAFSFEFFPPRTDAATATLREVVDQLAELKPRFCSVTFGAGGSTRTGTYETVKDIQTRPRLEAAPHISCIGSTRSEIHQILESDVELGVTHIVALRGDKPSGAVSPGEFRYADQLVAFIRKTTGDHFHIEVAAHPEFHPEAPNAQADLANFKRKVDAGADSALTQYFFSPEGYYRFVDACEAMGLSIPIVPGIMPITNYKQLARFSDNCGAEIPRWLRKRLEGFGDDLASIRAFGLDVVVGLCDELLRAGAPGLHVYTLNRAAPTRAIWERLGLDGV